MNPELHLSTLSAPLGRKVKGLSDTSYADLNTWPTPDEGALDEKLRAQYLDRKKGVTMYLSGCAQSEIQKASGIGLKQAQRLIKERCIQTHPDGLIYGWRGLIPNLHIRPYRRTKPVKVDPYGHGAAGAMQTLLALHPDLCARLEKHILDLPKPDQLGQIKKPRMLVWKWFINELRKLGYEQRGLWPFNTKSNGYYSVCRHIDQVFAANPKKATRILGSPGLEKKLISGDGVDRPVDRVFQRVEMDAHKLDGRFCVMMPQVTGGYVPKIIHRIWVVVILEVYSRAVLGYYLSLGREVSKDDVMRTIKMALTKWHRRNLSFSDLAFSGEAGLPSGISDKFVGACWDETSVDGALAECCKTIETILNDVVGSKLITPYGGFSSRRSKDDRPFIESFFRTLGSNGFQRLSNTTGANPSEKQGRDPEKVAVTSQFQLEYLEELLDVLITNYNATPHSGLGYRSPLQYLQFICARPGEALRQADPNSVQGMLNYRKKCWVLGGIKSGRKPYVNFEGARYTNEILGQRFDLVGHYIWVVNHLEDDARVAQASTLDGMQLGVLRAAPPWHKLPHSLRVRSAINAAVRRRMFTLANTVDAIGAFLEFQEAQADKKLPVHPAYLELRRILEQQAQLNVGESVLETALNKTSLGLPEDPSPQPNAAPTVRQDTNLPTPRMAASD
ncbi:MAG: hypothetical protein NTV43_18210 [Methylococcales bacterium]|nr:hypothetical protein [Methylococcales bacterium]